MPAPLLTDKEETLLHYLRRNVHRPEFAVARRQRFHRVLELCYRFGEHIDALVGELRRAHQQAAGYKHVAAGLHFAATGQLTAEQIAASALTEQQQADCHQLATLYADHQTLLERLRPRPICVSPPPGELILVQHVSGKWFTSLGLGSPAHCEELRAWLPFPSVLEAEPEAAAV